jgi:hypothetical protein
MSPNEPLPQWRTAPRGLKGLWVLVMGLWLAGFAAWFAYHYYAADGQVRSRAETAFLIIWVAMGCIVVGKRLFDRYRR